MMMWERTRNDLKRVGQGLGAYEMSYTILYE